MKQCIEIQPHLWQSLYQLYYVNSSLPKEEIILKMSGVLQQYQFSEEWATKTATLFYTTVAQNPSPEEGSPYFLNETEAILSLLDIQKLHSLLRQEEDDRVKSLLIAFAIFARCNPHRSNWIRYDKKTIYYLAGISKLKTSEQELLTNKLHYVYNLNMQVVGSNQPTPCFQLTWQVEQAPLTDDSGDNPPVMIGPLSPATIKNFVSKFQDTKEE